MSAAAATDLFVTPAALSARLGEPRLKVVDGSWHLDASRDARAAFEAGHVPGAVFFDLDAVSDRDSPLPHMLPSPAAFAEAAGSLGISDDDDIVIYDTEGLFSAARVRWTFRVFGAKSVRILSGGLPAWRAAGLPLETGPATPERAHFAGSFDAQSVVDLDAMRRIVEQGTTVILDARPAGRFEGTAPEPRAGLRSGHMPGSKNLPAGTLVEDGRLIDPSRIRAMLDARGVAPGDDVVTTCGSGVTAALIGLALETAGYGEPRLYDGSWAEWGGREDTPIVTGS